LLLARYPHEPTSRVARDLRRSAAAVSSRALQLGLAKSPEYLASPEACRPPGWAPGRMAETQFKPGERRGVAVRLYKPIGHERLSKEGYLQRKIHDGLPRQSRWRAVHLLVWEAANGPLPQGHVVAFRNGDKRDIRLENLECIPRRELMRRNTIHRLPQPLAETIQLLGALNRQIRQRQKRCAA
jgi:hypothetical protein